MHISDLIKELQNVEAKHGDLRVCYTESHEYWGTLYEEVSMVSAENAQPDGPKSGKSELCAVISRY